MKIAMLGHKRIPSREGGVEVVVEQLAKRMVELGHEVTVFNRRGKHVSDKSISTKKTNNYLGINIKSIFTVNKKGLDALIYSVIASILASLGKYDVIHYHAEGACAMLWLPRLFKKRLVVTIHGLDWQRDKWGGFASRYIRFGEKIAVKYADEIIVLSQNIQQYFLNNYNRETTYIPNGVLKPEIKKAKLIKGLYSLEKDDYILFLARIVPEKGVHYLVDAFKEIETDKKLVIAGGSSHSDDYFSEIVTSAALDNRIIMTGFVAGDVLSELYSNAYLYVLPSDVEGMPLSLLEALSYGNFCLVSNIPENVELIADLGATFNAGDVVDLIDKIRSILDNNNTNKERITNYVCSQYNWDDIVDQTLTIYRKGDKNENIDSK